MSSLAQGSQPIEYDLLWKGKASVFILRTDISGRKQWQNVTFGGDILIFRDKKDSSHCGIQVAQNGRCFSWKFIKYSNVFHNEARSVTFRCETYLNPSTTERMSIRFENKKDVHNSKQNADVESFIRCYNSLFKATSVKIELDNFNKHHPSGNNNNSTEFPVALPPSPRISPYVSPNPSRHGSFGGFRGLQGQQGQQGQQAQQVGMGRNSGTQLLSPTGYNNNNNNNSNNMKSFNFNNLDDDSSTSSGDDDDDDEVDANGQVVVIQNNNKKDNNVSTGHHHQHHKQKKDQQHNRARPLQYNKREKRANTFNSDITQLRKYAPQYQDTVKRLQPLQQMQPQPMAQPQQPYVQLPPQPQQRFVNRKPRGFTVDETHLAQINFDMPPQPSINMRKPHSPPKQYNSNSNSNHNNSNKSNSSNSSRSSMMSSSNKNNMKWQCTHCTYFNELGKKKCGMCGGVREVHAEVLDENIGKKQQEFEDNTVFVMERRYSNASSGSGSGASEMDYGSDENSRPHKLHRKHTYSIDETKSESKSNTHHTLTNTQSNNQSMTNEWDRKSDEDWIKLYTRALKWDEQSVSNRFAANSSKYMGYENSHEMERKFEHCAQTIVTYNDNAYDLLTTLSSVAKKLLIKTELKYQMLDTENAHVVSKLLGFDGVIDFLKALGFEPKENGSKLIVDKPNKPLVKHGIIILKKHRSKMEGNISLGHSSRDSMSGISGGTGGGGGGGSDIHSNDDDEKTNTKNGTEGEIMTSFFRPLSVGSKSVVSPTSSVGTVNVNVNMPSRIGVQQSLSTGLPTGDVLFEEKVNSPSTSVIDAHVQVSPFKNGVATQGGGHVGSGGNFSTPNGSGIVGINNSGNNGNNVNMNTNNMNNMNVVNNDIYGGNSMLIMALDDIIGWATHPNRKDSELMNTLLLTYKTFTKSKTLADRLIHRYNTNNLNHNVNIINNDKKRMENERKIQINVSDALREWIKHYWVLDFKSNTTLQGVILNFAQNMKTEAKYKNLEWKMKAGESILKDLAMMQQPKLHKKSLSNSIRTSEDIEFESKVKYANVNVPKGVSLDKLGFIHFAEQITLRTFDIFSNIEARELMSKSWGDEETRDIYSANVYAMIREFNFLNEYFQYSIVKHNKNDRRDFKKRCKALSRVIRLCVKFMELNNFHCLYAAYSCLRSATIDRLKKEFKQLGKTEDYMLNELEKIFSFDRNFKKLREKMHDANYNQLPCLPYLGTFLTDLTFITDGNKTYVENPFLDHQSSGSGKLKNSKSDSKSNKDNDETVINFNKCIRLHERIKHLKQFQEIKYTGYKEMAKDKVIQKLLYEEFKKWKYYDDNQCKPDLYQLSCTIYPKKKRRATHNT